MKAFGIDVSAYNGKVDWQKAKERNVSFAGMRATISWGYRDKWLPANLLGSADVGIYRMPYHVIYPKEAIMRQVDNFLLSVSDWVMPYPVVDAELDHGAGINQITDSLISFNDNVQARIGKRPIIYSRAEWINNFTLFGAWRSKENWWLAQYNNDRTTERLLPPDLPKGVITHLCHQNADKYPAFCNGPDGIKTIDINRWNGTEAEMIQFFIGSAKPPTPTRTWPEEADAFLRTLGYTGRRP